MDLHLLDSIFYGEFANKRQNLKSKKLVHYTSAENALNILTNNEVWLRNTRLANDYSEILWGLERVQRFFFSELNTAKRFERLLNSIQINLFEKIKTRIMHGSDKLVSDTYISCFSEHEGSENSTGRLSMWRAYGPKNGVGIIFKPDVFFLDDYTLGVLSYPCHYWSSNKVETKFLDLIQLAEDKVNELKKVDPIVLVLVVVERLLAFAISLKHPGFQEEKEWRIVYRPNSSVLKLLKSDKSAMKSKIETIGGVPQTVYKMPLDRKYHTDIATNLDSILVGPSEFSEEIATSFEKLLEARIPNVRNRISISEIPLRTQ